MIRDFGGKAYVDHCDVTSRTEVAKAAKRIQNNFISGPVSILVNNAGMFITGYFASILIAWFRYIIQQKHI